MGYYLLSASMAVAWGPVRQQAQTCIPAGRAPGDRTPRRSRQHHVGPERSLQVLVRHVCRVLTCTAAARAIGGDGTRHRVDSRLDASGSLQARLSAAVSCACAKNPHASNLSLPGRRRAMIAVRDVKLDWAGPEKAWVHAVFRTASNWSRASGNHKARQCTTAAQWPPKHTVTGILPSGYSSALMSRQSCALPVRPWYCCASGVEMPTAASAGAAAAAAARRRRPSAILLCRCAVSTAACGSCTWRVSGTHYTLWPGAAPH